MQTNDANRKRRRIVLIDREFQLSFICRLGGYLLFYFLLFLCVSVVGPVAIALAGGQSEWALMELSFRVEVLLRLILAPVLCTFICLFVHGIFETFRIAGPNFRFKAVMRDLGSLCIPRGVRTRDNDYLRDTTHEFNLALIALHDHVQGMQDYCRQALQRAQAHGNPVETLEALEELQARLQQIELAPQAPAASATPAEVSQRDVLPVAEPVA